MLVEFIVMPSCFLWVLCLIEFHRKEQGTARSGYGYGEIMGEKCHCKDSDQTWCTKYL